MADEGIADTGVTVAEELDAVGELDEVTAMIGLIVGVGELLVTFVAAVSADGAAGDVGEALFVWAGVAVDGVLVIKTGTPVCNAVVQRSSA